MLGAFPELRTDLVSSMKKVVRDMAVVTATPEHMFVSDMSTVGQLELTFMSVQITKHLPRLNEAKLASAKAYDPDSVKHVFAWMHHAALGCQLIADCKDKRVMTRVSDARVAAVGRANTVGPDFIALGGKINWPGVVYALRFEEPTLTMGPNPQCELLEITHVTSGDVVALEADIGIDSSFDLVNAWSDTLAELQKGQARRFKVGAFFSKPFRPHWIPSWVGSKCKPLKDTIEKANDEVNVLEAAGRTDTRRVEQAFENEAKHKREKASQKARNALKERQEESAKKRRFSCHSSPSPSPSPRPSARSDADAAAEVVPPADAAAKVVPEAADEAAEEALHE